MHIDTPIWPTYIDDTDYYYIILHLLWDYFRALMCVGVPAFETAGPVSKEREQHSGHRGP